jgi:putative tributyrin esterase
MKLTRAVLFMALAVLFHGSALKPAQSGQQAPVARSNARDNNKRVEIVSLESKLVGETLPYIVVLPLEYDQRVAVAKRYPVLYLLHGLGGHYDNWTTKTKLADYAVQYQMIIVTPEGNDGWYTDSAAVPKNKYETYFLEELIPDVQKRYRTVETRAGRGIAGLSMGGYGALKFAAKHPELFSFAGSMSGALDAASWKESDMKGLEFIWKSMAPVFGNDGSPTRKANDLMALYRDWPAERIKELPYVYLDCGTQDFLFPSSRAFAEILVSRKIPHEYRQLPGAHGWVYWDAQLQEVLKVASQKLGAPANHE